MLVLVLELDVVTGTTVGVTDVDVMDTIVDAEEVELTLVVGGVVVFEVYTVLVLTGSLVADVASVLLACVLVTAPKVPEGWMSRAM